MEKVSSLCRMVKHANDYPNEELIFDIICPNINEYKINWNAVDRYVIDLSLSSPAYTSPLV